MRHLLAALTAATILAALPASSMATVVEIGASQTPFTPSCPGSPCYALSKTTGYQAKVADTRGLMIAPKSGRLVAWTITLSKPTAVQQKFFETNFGGASQAQVTVLAVRPHLTDTVKAMTPLVALTPYFGGTTQFPLVNSLPVAKGNLIALTVPTWAPALQVGFDNRTSWRASRPKNKCTPKFAGVQTAQLQVGDKAQYACLYKTARLTYTATLITNPTQTNAPAKPAKPTKPKTRMASYSSLLLPDAGLGAVGIR